MGKDYFCGREDLAGAGELLPKDLALRWFSRLDSTNELAVKEDWPSGTVIAADEQDRGRGRLGRAWQSPSGLNLYFSLVFFPSLSPCHWPGFPLAVGAALADALSPLAPGLGLKWPNDLLVPGGKLGGILLETAGGKLVAGVGLNVNQTAFPPELSASSLALLSGCPWCRDRLLAVLAPAVLAGLRAWDGGRTREVLARWRRFDILWGKRVAARRGGELIEGRVLAIDDEGRLILEDDRGVRQCLASGEVTLRR
jgi:BirA family biotin operon repressor/biotin-[acetyl-CoA-carboxylase] ligase